MKNRDIEATWKYHDGTKHSYQSIRSNPHSLDWENQPIPFKIYRDLGPIPLRQQLTSSGMPALSAVSANTGNLLGSIRPTRQLLAEILFLSAGVTKRRSYPGGEMLFRAAACTGALFHVDLYIVAGEVEDLEAGVYHFGPQDFALRRLRQGDYRGAVARASGGEPAIAAAPLILICASTFWRNSWKYQSRAYRHCYWDNGTILANLLAACAARKLPAKIILGFVDEAVSRLLGLDRQREAPLSLIALGRPATEKAGPCPAIEPIALETVPLSKKEIVYPAMAAMHEASSLESEEEVLEWRRAAQETFTRPKDEGKRSVRAFVLRPANENEMAQDGIEEVIIRRGSTRQFSRVSISFIQLSTMLDRATRGIAVDFLNSTTESLNDLYLIVNAVDDLPSGAYVYRGQEGALELLKEGDFRREAGYLGLGQAIPADCSVNVYFMTDLRRVLDRFGNRGYRAAQLEASIMGGKLYLAAYAQRLGASGLTFFDDDVAEFFSPHAAGKSVMFLIALGKSVKRKGLNIV